MPTVPIQPPKVRRFFGIDTDSNSSLGGTDYDTLTNSGASPATDVPDVAIKWPATTFDTADNPVRADRSVEVRGHRAMQGPIELAHVPSATFTVPGYRYVAEKLLKGVMGKEGTITGTNPGPYTHPLTVIDYADAAFLPSFLLQGVRDNVQEKLCGAMIDSVAWTLPIGAESTMDVTAHGKYLRKEPKANSFPSLALPSTTANPLMLRNVKVYFDGGAVTTLPITQVVFGFSNNLDTTPERVLFAGRNVETKTIGAGSQVKQIAWPTYFRLSGGHTVTYSLTLANPDDAQDLAAQWGQVQKIVTEISGDPITGASANELIRVTKYAVQWDNSNVDALAARGDLGQTLSGQAYYSDADSNDLLVEVVNGSSTAI